MDPSATSNASAASADSAASAASYRALMFEFYFVLRYGVRFFLFGAATFYFFLWYCFKLFEFYFGILY